MSAVVQELDPARVDAFGRRMLGALNEASLALLVSVGHRTGLVGLLATLPPCTSAELAAEARLSERYVRQWLDAMVVSGVVEHETRGGRYFLPREHAGVLTSRAPGGGGAVAAQWISVLASVESQVVDAFHHGRGVPPDDYARLGDVTAEESRRLVVDALARHVLPLAPGLPGRLEAGADVLEVMCGRGQVSLWLARRFPRSRFTAIDGSAEAVATGDAQAVVSGLDNVVLEVRDAVTRDDEDRFDLVLALDAVQGGSAGEDALPGIRRALRRGGTLLMRTVGASSAVDRNLDHPLGPFLYARSCLHGLPSSLAAEGPGGRAAWGREAALAGLATAGFGTVEVRRLPHDPLHDYYVAR